LDSKTALTPLGKAYYNQYVGKLTRHFGNRLVSDITAGDIAALQRKRQGEGLSGRQVNCEVATLRAVLRHYDWAQISARVRMQPERTDTGRALSEKEERQLLDAIAFESVARPLSLLRPVARRWLAAGRNSRPSPRRFESCLARGCDCRGRSHSRPLEDRSRNRPRCSLHPARLRGVDALALALS
jgi:hypothetical protein